ncbi:uncharacterized protein KY384_006711 [Bacidia gigantensis]|uniref:uncharacterized protein n=1 Tax=Bacidia gigantensis TaxID=2732470 RepID=UPI001D054D8E|nr:uncharacterized protein KY384_006711 [Bacidia gigantensis]KAG8529021.1 hypothetical protein KY384_006711 [Bacidia gigantensis]
MRSRSADERRPLLADEALVDHPPDFQCSTNPFANLPVYANIHRVRQEVIVSLDDSYSLDQLRAPRINVSVVRPLVNRLWEIRDVSIVYCLLVNKLQFLREQDFETHQTVHTTRAHLCELVALKILRRFDEDHPGNDGLCLLCNIMVAGFKPFQNAPPEIIKESNRASGWAAQRGAAYEKKSTALEVAIISDSKLLISSPASQKVMDAIYVGRIIYTPSSFLDILPDRYKYKPIMLYRPEDAPLLNQYRLMVPRTRNLLDICQFIVLLVLYVLVMQNRNYVKFTGYELIFCIYALGWVLDEFASVLEHGWYCYTQNLWSFLDAFFAGLFLVYFALRMHSLATHNIARSAAPALDILSAAAPVLIPRLAFNLMTMMSDFLLLTILAIWCFGGFLLSLSWLSGDVFDNVTISKWMLYVWFGLDGTGIQKSVEFHPIIGPTLFVAFAFLGNTLFLTILVSMLSSTFAKIASNASSEVQFRRAVLTFEGVKSDSIFAYMPPFNILALCLVLPMKLFASPRWFHKINVALIRFLNAPLLLAIAIWERHSLWPDSDPHIGGRKTLLSLSKWTHELVRWWDFSRFSVHGDIELVFDFDPPQVVADDVSELEEAKAHHTQAGSRSGPSLKPEPPRRQSSGKLKPSKRKESFATMNGLADTVADFFHEHGGAEINAKFSALEKQNKKIEAMLEKIYQNMGGDDSEDDNQPNAD